MARIIEVCPGIFQVGGSRLSYPEDCCVYLVEGEGESALIDSGAGKSAEIIIENMVRSGVDIDKLKTIIVTHGHIDHIGGLKTIKERLQARVVCHELELPAVEQGLPQLTAAGWYGVNYRPVEVEEVLKEEIETIKIGGLELVCVHTPGHTPGGISVYVDIDDKRVLFGQDIHGPFNREWGSDMKQWRQSMEKLLKLEADILCEGHFGIYSSASVVRDYINSYLQRY